MNLRHVGIVVVAGGFLVMSARASGEAPSPPATLAVAHSAELGPLSDRSWDNAVRWGQLTVTRDGRLVFFYCRRPSLLFNRLAFV